jgi:hypothetical protein
MRTSRDIQTAGRFIHREVIPTAFTTDFELFDYLVLGIYSKGVHRECQAAKFEFFQDFTVPFI